jgi:uncharacterized protein YndB with AHSA1/START domain
MATRDSGSATTLLEYRTELAAPVDRVFAALTEAAHLARWLSDEAESDAAPGGRVVFTWRREGSSPQPFTARWVVFQPPTSCAFEGGHAGYPDGYGGRIGFELAPRRADGSAGTVLITRHRLPTRLDYEPVIATYRSAWPRALGRLVAYLTPGR